MGPARISGHRLDPRSPSRSTDCGAQERREGFFIVGSGLVALVLVVSPRWEAAQRRSGIYSDTYSSFY
jgi:hypothetical protein